MTNREMTAGKFGRLFCTLALFAMVSAASCESCDGGTGHGTSGGGGGGTSSWLVGRGGLMLNLDEHGRMGRYPLETRGDLLSIACWGASRAWVAGDDGVLLTTEDAGATWRTVDAGSKTRLRAVAIAEKGHIFVAGDEGLFRVSADNGLTFQTVAAPNVVWTSVAPRYEDGGAALLTTAGGDIYRWDGTALSLVTAKPAGGLNAVALSEDGRIAVAVGEGGAMLVSTDGGQRWRDRPSGTTRALRDVWLIGEDGKSVYAVGDGGVLVRGWSETSDGAAPRSLGQNLILRGLHLEASGHGAIVGDGGSMFVTTDFGESWLKVETGDARDIFSVDALGADHQHL